MNNLAKFGLAAAAVVVAAAPGLQLFLVAPNIGAPARRSDADSDSAGTVLEACPAAGDLEAGAYSSTSRAVSSWPITVPAEWHASD